MGGAAKYAYDNFNARWGQAEGIQGQSYAIATLDEDMRRVPLSYIDAQLRKLNDYAREHIENEFLLTPIGCGIAGFSIAQIREICLNINWTSNIVLPKEFQ